MLYPLNWLLLGLAAVVGAKWWLVAVKIVLHFWLAGVGMYAFLRRRGTPIAACYAAGVFFILTYPFSHAMFSALNWGMAWAPWILLAVEAWAERPRPATAATVALTIGMAVLTGAPAAVWYTMLVALPYAVWAVWRRAGIPPVRRAYLRAVAGSGAIAAGLLVALTIAQLHATLQLVSHTVRDQRDLAFIATTAFTPDDLFGMLVPRMPGEGPYLGIVAVFGIAAALSLRPTTRHLVLAGVAVLGVLWAWGDVGPFLPTWASVALPFGLFRRAHRYLYVTMVPLAILGAEGLALLARLEAEELRRRAGRLILVAGAIGVIIFGCGVVVTATQPNRPEPLRDAFALAFASTVVATWVVHQLVVSRGKQRATFLALAALVLSCDLWFARHPVVELNFYPIPVTPRDGEVRRLAGVPLDARIYDREFLKFRPGLRLGVRDLGGYEGDPLALSRYARFLAAAAEAPQLLGHANVRYLLEGGNKVTKKTSADLEALRPVKPGVYEVKDVAPAVLWVDSASVVANGQKALEALRTAKPGTIAVREGPRLATVDYSPDSATPPVAGKLIELRLNSLVAEVDAPASGNVIINEAYYPGWEATVDGKPTEVYPVNGLFRGLSVTDGHHRIELSYRAPLYLAGSLLSFAALGACLMWIATDWRRQARLARSDKRC